MNCWTFDRTHHKIFLKQNFDYSDVLLDIVVGGAVALVKRYRTDGQTGEVSQHTREASSARIKNAVA